MNTKLNFSTIPFLRLTIALFSGTFLNEILFNCEKAVVLPVVLIVLLPLLLFAFKKKIYFNYALVPAFMAVGFLLHNSHSTNALFVPKSKKTGYVAIAEQVKARSYGKTDVLVKLVPQSSTDKAFRALIQVSTDTVQPLLPGDVIAFNAFFEPVVNNGNPGEFDYKSYLNQQHIAAKAVVYNYIKAGSVNTTERIFHLLRTRICANFKLAGIEGENLALIQALTTGDKSLLDREQKETFSQSGIVHILAVSGLHVGIIYVMLLWMLSPFSKLKYGRIVVFSVTVIMLLCYAVLTGLSASVTRAVCMFILIDTGRLLRKQHIIYNIILASAFFLVVFDTHYLFQMGFWLSYGAVLSIIGIMSAFKTTLHGMSQIPRKISEIVIVTLAAQPGTFPMVLYGFGKFPVYFLLANIMVVPLVGIVIYAAFAVQFLIFLFPQWHWVGYPLDLLLSYIHGVSQWVSSMPGAVLENIYIDTVQMFVLILVSVVFIALLNLKNPKLLAPLFALLILFTGYDTLKIWHKRNSDELVIFNTRGNPLIGVWHNDSCFLYGTGSVATASGYTSRKNTRFVADSLIPYGNRFIMGAGLMVEVVSDKMFGDRPLQPDVLIFDRYVKADSLMLSGAEVCIVTSRYPKSEKEVVRQLCNGYGVLYWDLKKQGAFCVSTQAGKRERIDEMLSKIKY